MFQTNDPVNKHFRKELRRNQTYAERLLWQKLRNNGLGYKFYRQFSIGEYIVDLYCNKKKLAIELDGSQHAESVNRKSDERRTAFLNAQGITVVRFWNNEVIDNLEGVLQKIMEYLDGSS